MHSWVLKNRMCFRAAPTQTLRLEAQLHLSSIVTENPDGKR